MIIFLTLLYVGVLLVLVRFKVVPWNAFWKMSPAIWLILLLVAVVIPMNWGAPSGDVVIRRQSVSIVPNVAGEVIDVPVQPNTPLRAGDILFRIDPLPYEAQVRHIAAQLRLAELNLERATTLEQRQAGTLATLQQREVEVDALRAQLAVAEWNLDKTTVRAPSDGFVTNIGLRRGARVAALPVTAVMAFIETDDTLVGIQVQQIYARHIARGQAVELALKFRPGKIYTGRVVGLLPATAPGQQQTTGAAAQSFAALPAPFGVRVELDDPDAARQLPAGTSGEAAVYTNSVQATHIVRRVMIRMSTYLNYVIPF